MSGVKMPKAVSEAMALDVALGLLDDSLLAVKYDLSKFQLDEVKAQKAFQRKVIAHREKMEDAGKRFKVVAREKALDMLSELETLAKNPRAAALARVKAANLVIEHADYPMEARKEEGGTGKVQLVINTNLALGASGAERGTYTIEARPEREALAADDGGDLL